MDVKREKKRERIFVLSYIKQYELISIFVLLLPLLLPLSSPFLSQTRCPQTDISGRRKTARVISIYVFGNKFHQAP